MDYRPDKKTVMYNEIQKEAIICLITLDSDTGRNGAASQKSCQCSYGKKRHSFAITAFGK